MKTSLLAVLLFQLLIQVEDTSAQYKYGDIIAFQREKNPFLRRSYNFTRFGIYIDKLRFPEYNQTEGQNLFHITGVTVRDAIRNLRLTDCVFGNIEQEKKTTVKVFNYLDNINNIPKMRARTESAITERILCKLHNCQRFRASHDNDEHLATYVRYGVPICLKFGQKKEGKCHNKRHGLTKEQEQEIIKQLKVGYNGTENEMAKYYEELEKQEGEM